VTGTIRPKRTDEEPGRRARVASYRDLGLEELLGKKADLERDLFEQRLTIGTAKAQDLTMPRKTRKEYARLLTIINEREKEPQKASERDG
jgi:ribosomal protein L29